MLPLPTPGAPGTWCGGRWWSPPTTAQGVLVTSTGVQVPSVLDDLYPARRARLGAIWTDGGPSLAVWAPTAQQVTLDLLRRHDRSR